MAIKTGQAADADEVMTAIAHNFVNNAQTLFDSAYNGFDSRLNLVGSPNLLKLDYDVFTSDTAGTKTNLSYSSTLDLYYTDEDSGTITTLDLFADASVNAALWDSATTGSSTLTESGTTLRLGGNNGYAQVTSDNAIFSTYNDNVKVRVDSIAAGQSDRVVAIELTDGANTVILQSKTGTSTQSAYIVDFVSVDANNVKVRVDGGAWTNKDISSITGTVKLRLRCEQTGGPGIAQFDYVKYGSGNLTVTFVSDVATTSGSTITNAILTINRTDGVSGGATYYMSADNGANFETVTPNSIHRFTNTGTQLKVKVEATAVTIWSKGFDIYEYAAGYNFY